MLTDVDVPLRRVAAAAAAVAHRAAAAAIAAAAARAAGAAATARAARAAAATGVEDYAGRTCAGDVRHSVKGAAACREACAADASCVAFAVATGRAGQCVTSATCTPLNYERRAGWEVHARLAPLPDCWAPGALYGGHTAITKSGVNCQKWTEQWPHTHLDTPLARPGAGLGDHRYCRQVGEAVAWCYTTDPDRRREACTPQSCVAYCTAHGLGYCSESRGCC